MSDKKCSIWWCGRPHYANGFCKAHDTANKRFGSPYGRRVEQMSKVETLTGQAYLLAETVKYAPGPTRDQLLLRYAKLIQELLGEKYE